MGSADDSADYDLVVSRDDLGSLADLVGVSPLYPTLGADGNKAVLIKWQSDQPKIDLFIVDDPAILAAFDSLCLDSTQIEWEGVTLDVRVASREVLWATRVYNKNPNHSRLTNEEFRATVAADLEALGPEVQMTPDLELIAKYFEGLVGAR